MKELIIKAKQGDKKSLEEILIKFQPLINNTAASFYIYGYEDEDIKQIATLEIINAVDKFNLNYGSPFTSYVKEVIRNAIYTEIEYATKMYYKDRETKEIAKLIEFKDVTDENINIEEDYIKKENKENLELAISQLNDEERKLLKALYIEGKSLSKYSEENNIEYHKARYIKDKTIKRLKTILRNI